MLIFPIYVIPGTYDHDQQFDVSVIIPLYKSSKVVAEQIQNWHGDKKYSVEIVYVDDCCPEKSKDVINEEWNKHHEKQHVKLILSPVNKGFAGACNIGARNANGKYLIFLNADTIVTPNWIAPMIDLFTDDVGIVGNLQLKSGGQFDGTIDSAGSEWSWQFFNFMHIGRHFHHGQPLDQPMSVESAADILQVGEREMVTGCCFSIPKKLFFEIGSFDQDYRIGYWEDADLNLKVREFGRKVLFTPHSVIHHKLGNAKVAGHAFIDANKRHFIQKWIINHKLDGLVKEKRPYDFKLDDDADRVYTGRMAFYRQAYKNSLKWDGHASLAGKKVIVYMEQGLGDSIQFFRYLKTLKELGCYTTVHCHTSLHELALRHVNGVDQVIDKNNEQLPEHDYHVLSLSLPFLLNKEHTDIFPYVFCSEKIELSGDYFNIGIAWEGSPDHSNNSLRSCPLKHFKCLTKIPKVRLFMLQPQIHNKKYIKNCSSLDLFSIDLPNLAATATLINSVDLVVTVDTAVLHLAGAMNKNTIGLLSEPADPRWGIKKWYNSICFVQKNNWSEVKEKVKKCIF